MGSVQYLLDFFMLTVDRFSFSEVGLASASERVVSRFFLAMRLIKLRIYDYLIIYRLFLKIDNLTALQAATRYTCTLVLYTQLLFKIHSLNQAKHTSKTHKMTQQLTLFNPSLHYYCHACRKSLQFSVRVIAKITHFSCFLDFCPPCLAHESYIYKIEDYFISKKVGPIFTKISNASASQLLQSISTVQKEGIEQMFLRFLKHDEDRQLQVYKQLNSRIFADEKAQLEVNFGKQKIPKGGIEKEKSNPPNRKHLKTLGYCWQREEFSFQPELVFGYLMSCVEEQEEPTEDQIELRNIIYNYYSQEVQIIEEIQQFLIQSPFLLARKSIYEIEQVPRQLTQLKNIQSEIKELIVSICNMNVEDQQNEENDSSTNKHGQRVKHRHKKHKKQNSHKTFQSKDQRERTRQKKGKKQNKNHKQQQLVNEQKDRKQNIKKQEEIRIAKPKSDSETSENTKKRGRPKGSKSKVKVQRRRGKSRVFQLKMDIENKISYKREMRDSKDGEEEDQSYENRKKRKPNQDAECQEQCRQQSQSYDESQRRRESSEDD